MPGLAAGAAFSQHDLPGIWRCTRWAILQQQNALVQDRRRQEFESYVRQVREQRLDARLAEDQRTDDELEAVDQTSPQQLLIQLSRSGPK
jgi:hypothetical protein